MNPETIEKLAAGLRRGNLPTDTQPRDVEAAVRSLADLIAGSEMTGPAEARAAARALNRGRYFDETRVLAEAWRDVRGFDPTIAKHHAQALINLSALDVAEQILEDALQQAEASDAGAQTAAEVPEYEGLLGRVAKQRFVMSGDRDALAAAIERYRRQYDELPSKPYWHGINVVALRSWLERNDGDPGLGPSLSSLAGAIYDQVESRYRNNPDDPWLCATASEASLALQECDRAELWLYRFLGHPKVQPFDVESYDRQLREIWQGDVSAGRTCADRLVTINSRHLQRTQQQWTVSSSAVRDVSRKLAEDPAALEKNFSGEGSFSLEIIRRMLASCASIGCVSNRSGARLGTGFLVAGDWLLSSWGTGPVFITNAHVIGETVPKAIRPEQALVSFEVEATAGGAPVFYPVAEVLFSSPPGDVGVRCPPGEKLDVTVVRLQGLQGSHAGLQATGTLPLIDPKSRAYVVGHPLGGGLQISLHDSALLDFDDDERLLHYRTPSDPGSSGSPVFNEQWEVVALHHAGSAKAPRLHGTGSYEANEGIVLGAIRAKLRA